MIFIAIVYNGRERKTGGWGKVNFWDHAFSMLGKHPFLAEGTPQKGQKGPGSRIPRAFPLVVRLIPIKV